MVGKLKEWMPRSVRSILKEPLCVLRVLRGI